MKKDKYKTTKRVSEQKREAESAKTQGLSMSAIKLEVKHEMLFRPLWKRNSIFNDKVNKKKRNK